MAEQSFMLTTIYENWKTYQEHISTSIAPLTAEQLTLRAAPGLRSIGENATHIVGCRSGWFTYVLKEDGGEEFKATTTWDQPPARTAAELVRGLEITWQVMAERIARWSDDDMHQTFEDDWDGKIVQLPRAWIIYHIMEHDLHHGGEISLTMGMHGIKADFPG